MPSFQKTYAIYVISLIKPYSVKTCVVFLGAVWRRDAEVSAPVGPWEATGLRGDEGQGQRDDLLPAPRTACRGFN